MPDRLEQIILPDYAVPMPHQICQKIENLGLDLYELAFIAQFAPLEVEHVLAEDIGHLGSAPVVFKTVR